VRATSVDCSLAPRKTYFFARRVAQDVLLVPTKLDAFQAILASSLVGTARPESLVPAAFDLARLRGEWGKSQADGPSRQSTYQKTRRRWRRHEGVPGTGSVTGKYTLMPPDGL